MPSQAEVVASDSLLGVNSVEVEGIEPWPDDNVGGLCLGVVMRSQPLSSWVPWIWG
jgi:hypothetical protein